MKNIEPFSFEFVQEDWTGKFRVTWFGMGIYDYIYACEHLLEIELWRRLLEGGLYALEEMSDEIAYV